MAAHEPQRQRSESEYPAAVRAAGPQGKSLYDRMVATLMAQGLTDEEAATLAYLDFPTLFARLAPAPATPAEETNA